MFSKKGLIDKKQRQTTHFWKGRQKENPKRKQNRKKRRIFKTGLSGEHTRKKPLKLQENKLFGPCFANTKQKHKNTKKNKTTKKTTNRPKKHLFFCILANNPSFIVSLCFFSSYTLSCLQSCVYWKHYKNSVFSRTQLLGITDSKAPFRGHEIARFFLPFEHK